MGEMCEFCLITIRTLTIFTTVENKKSNMGWHVKYLWGTNTSPDKRFSYKSSANKKVLSSPLQSSLRTVKRSSSKSFQKHCPTTMSTSQIIYNLKTLQHVVIYIGVVFLPHTFCDSAYSSSPFISPFVFVRCPIVCLPPLIFTAGLHHCYPR